MKSIASKPYSIKAGSSTRWTGSWIVTETKSPVTIATTMHIHPFLAVEDSSNRQT